MAFSPEKHAADLRVAKVEFKPGITVRTNLVDALARINPAPIGDHGSTRFMKIPTNNGPYFFAL